MRGKRYWFVLVLAFLCCMPLPVQAAKKEIKVKKVTLNQKSMTLYVGTSRKLKAILQPKKAIQKQVIWSSSNRKIASVTQKGTVKGKKKGTAIITVKVKGTNKKARCKVTVKSLPKCSDAYQEVIEKQPTCKAEGSRVSKCKDCGKIRYRETIKKLSHNPIPIE